MPMEKTVFLIPFLAITLGIGVVLTAILTLHRAKMRELDQRHKERMAAIEKGLDPALDPVPDEHESARGPLVSVPGKPPSRFLLRGLIWFFVGLAVALGGRGSFNDGFLTFAWVATAIGAANLAYYAVEGRKPTPPAPPPRDQLPPSGNGV